MGRYRERYGARTRRSASPPSSALTRTLTLTLTPILTLSLSLPGAHHPIPIPTRSLTLSLSLQERITTFLHLLSNSGAEVQHVCLAQCREAFSAMLSERQAAEAAELAARLPSGWAQLEAHAAAEEAR